MQVNFNWVFNEDADQEQVFNCSIKPLVHELLKGFNCSLILYGQQASGKTYTLVGELPQNSNSAEYTHKNMPSQSYKKIQTYTNSESRGMIIRTIAMIFQSLEPENTMVCSCYQVSGEQVYDCFTSDDLEL